MENKYRVITTTKVNETEIREHVLDCESSTTIEDVHTWLEFTATYHGPTTKISIAKLIH